MCHHHSQKQQKKRDERYAFCFVEGWDMRFTSRMGGTNIFNLI